MKTSISTQKGQGYLLGFNDEICNIDVLERQAFELGIAEGLGTVENPSINKSWGTVGLLVNPDIDLKDKVNADKIRGRWSELYQKYERKFDYLEYRMDVDDVPVIDKDGFLHLPWTDEMNDFDFLIATPVVARPKQPLLATEIAEQMILRNYRTYFDKNRDHGIQTFQDEEILRLLDRG